METGKIGEKDFDDHGQVHEEQGVETSLGGQTLGEHGSAEEQGEGGGRQQEFGSPAVHEEAESAHQGTAGEQEEEDPSQREKRGHQVEAESGSSDRHEGEKAPQQAVQGITRCVANPQTDRGGHDLTAVIGHEAGVLGGQEDLPDQKEECRPGQIADPGMPDGVRGFIFLRGRHAVIVLSPRQGGLTCGGYPGIFTRHRQGS